MSHFPLSKFPNSKIDPFLETSPSTTSYNCIAWAFGDDTKWYWPKPINNNYWPTNISREININSFVKLFESIRYTICDDGNFESDMEKIAIFSKNGEPTHAARQLDNGFWTSKLGPYLDIKHSINAIEEGEYGMVEIYMKRKKS